MRLNLGCSGKLFPGWLNVDKEDMLAWAKEHNKEAVPVFERCFTRADIGDLLPQLLDDSVEAIAMIHVLDHFTPPHALWILEQCKRILEPGGVLRIEVEDLHKIMLHWQTYKLGEYIDDQPIAYRDSIDDLRVAFLIFGNLAMTPDYTGHKMIYTSRSLRDFCRRSGFERIIETRYGVSRISEWQEAFDTQPAHSLFMECIK